MGRPIRTSACVAAATVAATAALLAAPGGAAAATTCELTGAVLDVTMGAAGDGATLAAPVGAISVDGGSGQVTCAGATPTVNNTDAITVHNAPGGTNNVVRIAEVSKFAPGATDEPGDDEIEIFVNLNNGAGSELHVSPVGTGGSIVFGTGGINPNATLAEVEPDADIVLTDVPQLRAVGNPGPDFISAAGGRGTGGPLPGGIELFGGGGNDFVAGGAGSDIVNGSSGDDTVLGGAGPDAVVGGPGLDDMNGGDGADNLDGGPDDNFFFTGGDGHDRLVPGVPDEEGLSGGNGTDEVDFSIHLTAGVTMDLGGASMGATGVENVIGTNFEDVLRGDGGPNVLLGLQGNDVLEGRGGDDALGAGPGDDSLDVRDGGPDTADCGPDLDTLTADAAGIDTLTGCENVLFPAPPGPGAGGGSAGGGGEPPNDFTLGKVRKNKKRGTAKLTVEVGGPGALDLGGKSVKPASKEVATAGEVKLKIKAKGKKKAKLNQKGKTKVKPAVTYTPSGGTSNTQDITVKLIKR